jgi:hypothetical protein
MFNAYCFLMATVVAQMHVSVALCYIACLVSHFIYFIFSYWTNEKGFSTTNYFFV